MDRGYAQQHFINASSQSGTVASGIGLDSGEVSLSLYDAIGTFQVVLIDSVANGGGYSL